MRDSFEEEKNPCKENLYLNFVFFFSINRRNVVNFFALLSQIVKQGLTANSLLDRGMQLTGSSSK